MVKILRLVCPCGRNVADVRLPMAPHRWPHDDVRAVEVLTRPGVTGGLGRLHYSDEVSARSYTWVCRCRMPGGRHREHRRTDAKLVAAYAAERHRPEKIVTLILDRDL
ncbi:MAG: hypothetical protein ACM3ZF_16110 [Mycobacterium leprae]